MDLFRENIGRGVSAMHYNEGAVLWAKEEKADPRIVFQPNNQEAQEVFYRTIDDICATFDTVRKDDWRSLARICFASQAGCAAVWNQFPHDSELLDGIVKRTLPKIQAESKKTIKAYKERDAARWLQAQNACGTYPLPLVPLAKAPGPLLGIDESITYLDPETKQSTKVTVRGLWRVGKDKIMYTIAHVDSDDTEVELNEQEMSDILDRRM